MSDSALCLVSALLGAGWLCAQLLLLEGLCGWDALTALRASRTLLVLRDALGLCPAGVQSSGVPGVGPCVLPSACRLDLSAAVPLTLPEGKWLQGPLLQALDNPQQCKYVQLFGLEQ